MARLPMRKDSGENVSVWDPFRELNRINRELEAAMARWQNLWEPAEGMQPAADLEETDDAYLVEVELPGIRKEV